MALVDVTELLSDPDFVDSVTLIHRAPTVNSKGENILTETAQICTVGAVQPASGKTIQRLPDAFRVANVNSFWMKATIIADANGAYSDLIIWKGQRFTVQTVMDWSNYGAGYTEGTCVLERPAQS